MAKAKGKEAQDEDKLVAGVFDKSKHDQIAAAVKNLSSEEAEFFLWKLECAIRKRKIQITGYLVAIGLWAVGMFFALAYYGTHNGFVGWAFLAPFAVVGVVLWLFGKIADRAGSAQPRSVAAPIDVAPAKTDPAP
ncbi:MAG TPA: hypothetical protein VGM39_02250 [Kofleriaceae bacterium]